VHLTCEILTISVFRLKRINRVDCVNISTAYLAIPR